MGEVIRAAQQTQNASDMSLDHLARAIWARKLAFCLIFSVIAGSSIAICFLVAPIFQSEALIMVSEGQSQQSRVPETLRYHINSQLYMVESEDVLRQAIASVGARKLLAEPVEQPDSQPAKAESDLALLMARRQLAVTALKDSQVLQLTFRNSDPILAQEFLSSVVDAFLQRQAAFSGSSEAPSFFRQQAARYRIDYERASAKLREFSKTHSTYSIKQEVELALSRRDEIGGKLTTTRGSIADKEAQIATLQDTLSQLRKRISIPSEIIGPKFSVPAGRDLLTDNKIPSNDPPLLLVRVFQETAQTLVNLNASVVGLHALEESQGKALASIEARLADLSSAGSEFDRLKSEVDQASAILETHVKRTAEAQMNADWNASEKLSNVKVLQAATRPVKPVFPQKPILIALGGIIGLIGGAAACVGLETLARRRNTRPVTPAPVTLEVPGGRLDVHRFFRNHGRPAPAREDRSTFEPAKQPPTVAELSCGVPTDFSPQVGELSPGRAMPDQFKRGVEDGAPTMQRQRAPSRAKLIVVVAALSGGALMLIALPVQTAHEAARGTVAQLPLGTKQRDEREPQAVTEAMRTQQQDAARKAVEEREAAHSADSIAWQKADEVERQHVEAAQDKRQAREDAVSIEAAEKKAESEAAARRVAEAKRVAEVTARREEVVGQATREKAEAAREPAEPDARAEAPEAARRQSTEDAGLKAEDVARRASEGRPKSDAEAKQQAERAEAALNLSDPDRRRIQMALASLGYEFPNVTGYFGSRTRAMITAWQKTQGRQETGFLDGSQLVALHEQATLAQRKEERTELEAQKRKAEIDSRRP